MRHRMTTLLVGGGATLALLLGSGVTAGSAVGAPSAPIGPHQFFNGLVNGKHPTATITVVCPGPARLGQTGHPVAGQTVGVSQAPASTASGVGFTGSLGRSVVVIFSGPATTPPVTTVPLTFTSYGTQAIPTSLSLPCAGTAPVIFSPRPTSKTARNSVVEVTYLNIAV